MKTRLRHSVYWIAVALSLPLALFAIAGAWLSEHLEPLYGRLRRWAYQERYYRRGRE